MSASSFTTEDIYKQLLEAEASQQQPLTPGAQPPPLHQAPAKITIGDKEFEVTNTAGIQQAIQEQQQEYARLQALLAEQPHAAPAPQNQPPPVAPQPAAQPRAVKRKAWTPETMAEEIKNRALPEVFDEMLGQQLGVDSLLQTFQGMAQKIMAQEQAMLAFGAKYDELNSRLTEESMARASENFLTRHDDYVPSNENMQMIESYLKKNSLPWTEQGLHLAYLAAKTDNMLKLEKAETETQTQQTQQVATPQGATAQPSLRGGSSSPMAQDSQILDKFNHLPLEEQRLFIERFSQ